MATATSKKAADLEPDHDKESEGGTSVAPMSNDVTNAKICKVFQEVEKHKQSRKKANDKTTALREDLVTLGFSKKAQRVVSMFLNLNDDEQEFFDMQISIMRAALGKPVQMGLELVHSSED